MAQNLPFHEIRPFQVLNRLMGAWVESDMVEPKVPSLGSNLFHKVA